MPRIKILNKVDIDIFEKPPKLTGEERKKYFYLTDWIKQKVSSFKTIINKIGFILQFGYFKASNKFYISKKFEKLDVIFVANQLNIEGFDSNLIYHYKDRSFLRHQEVICEKVGFKKFNIEVKSELNNEAISICNQIVKPYKIFTSLISFLIQNKIEIPSYYTFTEIITNSLRVFENTFILKINNSLSQKSKILLDGLLEHKKEHLNQENFKLKHYKLALLKQFNQSTKTFKIKENISNFIYLKTIFEEIKPAINELKFSQEIIEYYAQIVLKSRVSQVNYRTTDKYLLLTCFVSFQYYKLNDILVEIILQSVRNKFNSIEREHKENFYNQRKERSEVISNITKEIKKQVVNIKQIKSIIFNEDLATDKKINIVKDLFSSEFEESILSLESKTDQLEKEANKVLKNKDYYELLGKNSIKIQNKVSQIIKVISFNKDSSNQNLIQALNFYKENNTCIDLKYPTDFLNYKEKNLLNINGKFNNSLYKVLLFKKVEEGIRSGSLNLNHSYKYKSFDDYLISRDFWDKNKDDILQKSGLLNYKDFHKVMKELKESSQKQFKTTNENILQNKNKYLKFTDSNEIKVLTPKKEKDLINDQISLFPKDKFFSIYEVLSTVDNACSFTNSFEHWQVKYNRTKPLKRTFFAGVIGYGCNLGILKTAKISRNINQNELENTVNWYFTNENLIQANNKVLSFIERLSLPKGGYVEEPPKRTNLRLFN